MHRRGSVAGKRRQAGGFVTGVARPWLQARGRVRFLDNALVLGGWDDFDGLGSDLPAGRLASLLAPAAYTTAAPAAPAAAAIVAVALIVRRFARLSGGRFARFRRLSRFGSGRRRCGPGLTRFIPAAPSSKFPMCPVTKTTPRPSARASCT